MSEIPALDPKSPPKRFKHACDPVLEDSCCRVVALRTNLDQGFQKGMSYHAHLFDGGYVLVNVPGNCKPYVAQPKDFVRVVEDHHEF